jgi:hypothetical protein
MVELQFTQSDLILEKQRRAQEKCDELQAKFSPYNENGLWLFCQHIAPEFYLDEKVPLKELSEIFRKVTLGELRKVLISFFPRGGKSRTTSIWIAWWLGYDQEGSFMRNCYNDVLAMDLSKAVIDIITSDRYKEVFPNVKLDPSARSKMSWQLDDTGIATYFGAGMNGTITGKGCNRAAIFDDPIKNPEEAMSESYLEKVDTFIDYALETRVETGSNCAEIIIQTRWSSKDPIGVRENDASWTKFIFPVLIIDEEKTVDSKNPVYKSICEAMFPLERALKIRDGWIAKGRGWMFDALFMCEPTDASFAKLSLDSLKRFSMKDLEGKQPDERLGWCDYANKGTDNLAAPFCWRFGRRKYIVGVVFSNEDSKQLEKPLIKKIIRFKPEELVFESNQGGTEFATNFESKYQDVLNALGTEVETRSATTNKEIRILLRLGEIKSDCYFLNDDEQDEDYRKFMSNLTSYGKFKYGKDDAPDAMAGLLSLMSDVSDVDIDYLGDNKILDIKDEKEINETESEDDDSDIVFF